MELKTSVDFETLNSRLEGEVVCDDLTKALYATDASVYRKLPMAVAFPKTITDIQHLINFATTHDIGILPRTAGTSLAGQCVGEGMVIDVSRYFTKIIGVDTARRTVRVQPGVIRDDLNRFLEPYGLFFGPNTSTSNRCMIGGMVGNNSSGTTSIQYGVTRDKVMAMQTVLSDGSIAVFEEMNTDAFDQKCKENTLEGRIYASIHAMLLPKEIQQQIRAHFPKPEIHRRNTGYAIDRLIQSEVFQEDHETPFNMCAVLTGSEGTLALTTEIILKVDPLPPQEVVMIAAHFASISDCLHAVVPVMKHRLYACEMMDKVILDCTTHNRAQLQNRFFVAGDPAAILMLELRDVHATQLQDQVQSLLDTLQDTGLSYANPILRGEEINQALALRKAGLGLLGNIIGDRKAVACIEDTAVALADLAPYIDEFSALMDSFDQQAVYYAHAGAGEIHLRPILNLKKSEDVALFKQITDAVAKLVKKYKGAMSGEHGDGIVRSSYIPLMIGTQNFELLKCIKEAFDPKGIFNPGKIVAAWPMEQSLRYEPDRQEPVIPTLMNFTASQGILRVAERCNGSGDCRKPVAAGGTMCPSYRATKQEKDTTRGRANALREFLTHSDKVNKFDHQELKEVFDLCISCKGCASECPSNVDVATLKAEFEYQYQKTNGVSLRTKLFANNAKWNARGIRVSRLTNFIFKNAWSSGVLKKVLGIAAARSLPLLGKVSLRSWMARHLFALQPLQPIGKLYFFVDEFTNYLDVTIGIDALKLLTGLGYQVLSIEHPESGRSYISKGLLEEAKVVADENVRLFSACVTSAIPLVGLEPSSILTFRDEYLRLAEDQDTATALASKVFLIDEFLSKKITTGVIKASQFTKENQRIKLHGHCHQKALSNMHHTFRMLNLPENFTVTIIPSGCCGMAGSFGYEKEHYECSMQIGEQTLFPVVRKSTLDTTIAANGTSCRHQIKDGTARNALHPITILKQALTAF